MANKNWLAQTGKDFTDSDLMEFGISEAELGKEGINRRMLDLVHQMNVEGYISEGMSESKARHMADKRRSMAMQAAKANGLTL